MTKWWEVNQTKSINEQLIEVEDVMDGDTRIIGQRRDPKIINTNQLFFLF